MESVNRIGRVHDPMRRGERALDEKTRELVDSVGEAEDYDLVISGQEYPYTEENTDPEDLPDWVETSEEGVHEKGEIPLAAVDADTESIDVFYDSISRFEQEKMGKARRLGRSVEQVNQEYGTDWSTVLYIQPEKAMYDEPEKDTGPGVWYTGDTLESLRSSQSFADLSSGLFGGWLELSAEELLEIEN